MESKEPREFESLALNLLSRAQTEIYENSRRHHRSEFDETVYEIVRELCKLAVEHLRTKS